MATVQTRRGHCWGHAAREEEGRMRHARRQPSRPKTAVGVWTCKARVVRLLPLKTVWPSGLRRWLKAPFRKGAGSNPAAVILIKTTTYERAQNFTPIGIECNVSLRCTVTTITTTITTTSTREHNMIAFILASRGESGWCSDVTSTLGAWRLAGVQFLLPGAGWERGDRRQV